MIVAAHQTMLAPQGAPLPYDAEVEYLESTGTQYIDTGVPLDGSLKTVFDFTVFSTTSRPFGAQDSRGTSRKYWFVIDGNYVASNCSLGSSENAPVQISGNPQNRRTTVTIDGKTVSAYGATATNNSWTLAPRTDDLTLGLFACHSYNSSGQELWALPASARLYSCSISDGSTLVRDFQPVRVGTVGYLYDRVSGELFGNAGTGAFTIGPDK